MFLVYTGSPGNWGTVVGRTKPCSQGSYIVRVSKCVNKESNSKKKSKKCKVEQRVNHFLCAQITNIFELFYIISMMIQGN